MNEIFIKKVKETRNDLVKVVASYSIPEHLELRTKIDALLIMYDQIVYKLSERQTTTKVNKPPNSKALHISNVSNCIFTVVDPNGDVINYWRMIDDARKHARELSKKHNILFEVISEPIF